MGCIDYLRIFVATHQASQFMSAPLVAAICGVFCIVAIYVAWKVYKDTRNMKSRIDEEDERR